MIIKFHNVSEFVIKNNQGSGPNKYGVCGPGLAEVQHSPSKTISWPGIRILMKSLIKLFPHEP